MAKLKPIKAAVIGCGDISGTYLKNLTERFKIVEIVGCSDIISERSRQRSEQFGIKQMTNEEIFNDPEIQIVINLTYPLSHYEVSKAALNASKNVYSEKMIAVELHEGEELVTLAKSKGVQFTVAPDTFLGGGLQTARWVVDSGLIGEPVIFSAICQRSYNLVREDSYPGGMLLPGGGIPFDMGGYYLHGLVNLFGGIDKVSGFTKTCNKQRKFLNPYSPSYGDEFVLDTINTISASLSFESGVMGSLNITSESANGVQKIEVIGTEGYLHIHDPNDFSGEIKVMRNGNLQNIPLTHSFCEESRGLGVADMAYAIKNNRKPRADASIGLNVFETIHKVNESTTTGKTYTLKNRAEQPKALRKNTLSGHPSESILDD